MVPWYADYLDQQTKSEAPAGGPSASSVSTIELLNHSTSESADSQEASVLLPDRCSICYCPYTWHARKEQGSVIVSVFEHPYCGHTPTQGDREFAEEIAASWLAEELVEAVA